MSERILLITRNFPPLVGGMERLVWHAYKELNTQYCCSVIGPSGCPQKIAAKDIALGCPSHPASLFLSTAMIKALYHSSTHKPSLCIGGSGLVAPITTTIGSIRKIPTLTFVHGLDLIVNNNIYQKFFIPAIRNSDIIIANSNNTAQLAEASGIAKGKIRIIHPGVTLPEKKIPSDNFYKQYPGLKNKKILLFVGRLVRRKGIVEFLRKSFPKVREACPETVCVILGAEPKKALKKDAFILKEIREAIQSNNLTESVMIFGNVNEETLSNFYQESSLFIFPGIDIPGDVEGFGMVLVEAAAHGLASAAFSVGGIADAVSDNESGFLIPKGNYNKLSETIISYLRKDNRNFMSDSCLSHAKKFTWDKFGKQLREICAQTLKAKIK
ncbi:MAG: glycosyltransferase family 4 protein [Candidatus Omnitrophota bacterium]